jgi:mevalonate kinase
MPAPSFRTTALGFASSAAVVVAVIYSVLAYRKIAIERRTVFELEVLRELVPLAASWQPGLAGSARGLI